MPSKTKKHSKSQSKLSDSAQSPSPLASPAAPQSDLSEDDLSRSLEEASGMFPSLIGKSAFIGRLTDVDSLPRGCKIWLSEVSMVAFNISPGSTVSVSLASREQNSSSIPLISLADECARHFGLEFQNKISNEVGSYFALATVFPSCKISKNGVRLSSNLSCTMGCPDSGGILFVYPIQSEAKPGFLNGNHKQHSNSLNCLATYNPRDLYLEFVPSMNGLKRDLNTLSPVKCPPKETSDRFENGLVSSPKTPSLYQSKLSSPSSGQLTPSACVASSLPNPNREIFNSSNISEVLGDERAKKLLQSCAISWLQSRSLLSGNFVTIPILSYLCIFHVAGTDKSPADIGYTDQTNPKSCKIFPTTCTSVDHVKAAFTVNHETKIYFILSDQSASKTLCKRELPHVQHGSEDVKDKMGYDALKLGGLSKEYAILKDIISSSMKDTLSSLGLQTTKGVLLHGPPGTGKTSLARLCARDTGINLFSVNGPEIITQYFGESEKALHEVFDSASQAAPAVVFIDELDAIAPARKEGGEELSQRMVATLLDLMDGISRADGVLVIAATNRPDSIEPALRRPGRLDREIEIGVPSPNQRLDILLTLLSDMDHCLLDLQIQQLATATHGFVGSDLAALCNEAALGCLRRHVKLNESRIDLCSGETSIVSNGCSDVNFGGFDCSRDLQDDYVSSSTVDPPVPFEILSSFNANGAASESVDSVQNGVQNSMEQTHQLKEKDIVKIVFEDFENARRKVRPSAMREVILEVPKVKWEDVGGQGEVKRQLMEAVEWPQKHQDAFKRIGTRPPTGVLLFGPPGCSKTLMARAVASEAGLNFLAVKGPELFSKWVGESEKAVRSLFAKARANAPSIIFFDEIDGLAVIRGKESDGISVADRVMSQLLVELDGLHQRVDVTVIAATNRPDKIDPALLRPGRFDRLLYVGPPDETERQDIFRIHLRKIPCSSNVSLEELACLTEGCTGADIFLICREAAVAAMTESFDASEITMEHLKAAIGQVQPSNIQSFHELSGEFQRLVHSSMTQEDLGHQPCVRRSNWISFWTRIKSFMQLLHQLPAALLWTKSRSGS